MKKLFILLTVIYLEASEFILEDVNVTNEQTSLAVIPYVFSSESTGLTGGVMAIMHGYYQPQMTMFLTAFLGEKQDVIKNYPEIKIQIMSGYSSDRDECTEDKQLSKKLLHKPFTSDDLLKTVRKTLDE